LGLAGNTEFDRDDVPTDKERHMQMLIPNRQGALEILHEFNKSDSLIRHALAVEAVMIHFSEFLNQDGKEKWGIIGLVHDLDFEIFPEEHCKKVREILIDRKWPEEYIRAIESHGWGISSDVKPVATMEKVLYTIDELTGLIAATALLRPSRSILDLEVKSVKKKWKQKGFATGVNREVIQEGAKILEMDLDTIIYETIKGMQKVAKNIGLEGASSN
jgi:predicted hydrolase (HD superfamily)